MGQSQTPSLFEIPGHKKDNLKRLVCLPHKLTDSWSSSSWWVQGLVWSSCRVFLHFPSAAQLPLMINPTPKLIINDSNLSASAIFDKYA